MPGQESTKQLEARLQRNLAADVELVVAEHDEELREKASQLEQGVVAATRKLRQGWIELAGCLYEFARIDGWTQLGYKSFQDWINDPRFDIGQSEAYRLIQAYREFVVVRGIEPGMLGRAHWSKVQLALPAVRREQVDPARAIADAEELSYGDLRERYTKHSGLHGQDVDGGGIEPDDFVWERCEACGSWYKRKVSP